MDPTVRETYLFLLGSSWWMGRGVQERIENIKPNPYTLPYTNDGYAALDFPSRGTKSFINKHKRG